MNRTLLAAVASFTLILPAGAVLAQDTMNSGMAGATMTAEQRTMYDGWPADRRTSYDSWPDTYKTYYWTLSPEQQSGWWVLNDDQRSRVYAMMPEQRTAAWASITAQMNGAAPSSAPMNSTDMADNNAAPPAMATTTGTVTFVRNAMVQNIPMDQATGDVPICNEGQTDNCINAWEAGKRGPNVTRPLNYWPGKADVDGPGMKPEGQ